MRFNLAVEEEARNARGYLLDLQAKKEVVELKKVSPKRSLNQNSYLHVLLGMFGVHFGYTLEEAKLIYKQLNTEVYQYGKKSRVFYRSSADLSTEEMARTIDKFRAKSAEQGLDLPSATDEGWLREIENEIERSNHYL
jgi:hypothetical protein